MSKKFIFDRGSERWHYMDISSAQLLRVYPNATEAKGRFISLGLFVGIIFQSEFETGTLFPYYFRKGMLFHTCLNKYGMNIRQIKKVTVLINNSSDSNSKYEIVAILSFELRGRDVEM